MINSRTHYVHELIICPLVGDPSLINWGLDASNIRRQAEHFAIGAEKVGQKDDAAPHLAIFLLYLVKRSSVSVATMASDYPEDSFEIDLSAKITVTFYGESDDDDHPGVANISLNGSYSLLPTTQSETITNGLIATARANVLSTGQLSLEKNYSKTINRENSDATYVSGATCLIGVEWDPANAVEWKLQENATLKTGLPAALRAGILLKRESMDNFKCAVDIESEVDLKTNVGRWFGGKPKDDPVLFKPTLKPTNRLMQYDANNLGKFDMSLVEDVTFTTIFDKAVKHRN
ncbi:hypothetical protein ZTR_11219 [Talaromyces verruculosus]|nr:hypothetical protein ZTR_11219 [Talaromyces verruculosus]